MSKKEVTIWLNYLIHIQQIIIILELSN